MLYFILIFFLQIISPAISPPLYSPSQSPSPFPSPSPLNIPISPSPIRHQRRNSFTALLDSPRQFVSRRFSNTSSKRVYYPSGTKSGELTSLHRAAAAKPTALALPFLRSKTQIPKKAVPKCDCGYWARRKMKNIMFLSDVDFKKERKVKVAIWEGPFAGGKWAKLFNGCFQANHEKKSQKWECVGVKLVGKGTIQSPKMEKDNLTVEQILDDPRKEVQNLQTLKKTLKKPSQRKHIIKLYDGGEIFYTDKEDRKKYENEYQYAVILELGGESYLDAFVKLVKESKNKLNEQKIMHFMATGIEPFIGLHKILVHLDLKPQNMLYVTEKLSLDYISGLIVRPKTCSTFEDVVLKLIDFGGARFLPQNPPIRSSKLGPAGPSSSKRIEGEVKGIRLEKVSSTGNYVPPEIDLKFKYNLMTRRDIEIDTYPIATTKSDMWEFGMLIYNLILVSENPREDKDEKNWQKEISSYMDGIHKLYEEGNEVENVDELLEIRGIQIEAFARILHFRSKYPRLYLLVTNLLDKNQNERLSALGAFEYLKMECRLENGEKEDEKGKNAANFDWILPEYANAWNKFIGNITIKMLKKSDYIHLMGYKSKIKLEFSDKSIKKMMEEDEDKMKGVTKICDRNYSPGEMASSQSQHSARLILPEKEEITILEK